MKRNNMVAFGLAVVMLAAMFGVAGPASAAEEFNWKFQSHHTPGSLAVEKAIKPFIERVEKMSGGRLKISLHYAGE
ncbi:MAG: hypothetical protein ACP5DY_07445, partial [Thermovirgaceae bacterium]